MGLRGIKEKTEERLGGAVHERRDPSSLVSTKGLGGRLPTGKVEFGASGAANQETQMLKKEYITKDRCDGYPSLREGEKRLVQICKG